MAWSCGFILSVIFWKLPATTYIFWKFIWLHFVTLLMEGIPWPLLGLRDVVSQLSGAAFCSFLFSSIPRSFGISVWVISAFKFPKSCLGRAESPDQRVEGIHVCYRGNGRSNQKKLERFHMPSESFHISAHIFHLFTPVFTGRTGTINMLFTVTGSGKSR